MRSSIGVAALATLLCAGYIGLNVVGSYGGNVSGLFYTGTETALPAELEAEGTWRVHDPKGYDAQFYHLVLHDPLLTHGLWAYADNPSLRFRRLGIPGLAALLHAITAMSLHWAYVLVQLAFVFLGSFWLASYASSVGVTVLAGLGFLAVPAVLVSIDRMTVDLALAALCIGFIRYGTREPANRHWPLYLILVSAPLVRETGMLLIAGWAIWNLRLQRWREVARSALCALPAVGWWVYVQSRVGSDGTPWLAHYPFSGVIDRMLAGDSTPKAATWLKAAWATEHLAFASVWVAIACCVLLVWRRHFGLAEVTALAFLAFASLLGKPDIWDSAYATGRTMSPLFILLGLVALRDRQMLFIVPMLLVLPRIILQFQAQITGSIRAFLQGS